MRSKTSDELVPGARPPGHHQILQFIRERRQQHAKDAPLSDDDGFFQFLSYLAYKLRSTVKLQFPNHSGVMTFSVDGLPSLTHELVLYAWAPGRYATLDALRETTEDERKQANAEGAPIPGLDARIREVLVMARRFFPKDETPRSRWLYRRDTLLPEERGALDTRELTYVANRMGGGDIFSSSTQRSPYVKLNRGKYGRRPSLELDRLREQIASVANELQTTEQDRNVRTSPADMAVSVPRDLLAEVLRECEIYPQTEGQPVGDTLASRDTTPGPAVPSQSVTDTTTAERQVLFDKHLQAMRVLEEQAEPALKEILASQGLEMGVTSGVDNLCAHRALIQGARILRGEPKLSPEELTAEARKHRSMTNTLLQANSNLGPRLQVGEMVGLHEDMQGPVMLRALTAHYRVPDGSSFRRAPNGFMPAHEGFILKLYRIEAGDGTNVGAYKPVYLNKDGLITEPPKDDAQVIQVVQRVNHYDVIQPLTSVRSTSPESAPPQEQIVHATSRNNVSAGLVKERAQLDYECSAEGCGERFRFYKTLSDHINIIHMGEKPYKCPHCNYTSKYKPGLNIHLQLHSGEKQCPHCDYTSKYKQDLNIHLRTHSSEKPYKCPHCNYASKYKHIQKIHLRLHSGEIPYKCKECNYTSTRSDNLKGHWRYMHSGEKPYKCEECTYESPEKSKLKRHMRIHTSEKPYKCEHPGCDFASKESGDLKRHNRRHTGEKSRISVDIRKPSVKDVLRADQ